MMQSWSQQKIIDTISKGKLLANQFQNSTNSLQVLFCELIKKSIQYSDNQPDSKNKYVNDMKVQNFRMAKEFPNAIRKIQNYCMYTLVPKQHAIKVELRTDNKPIHSAILKLKNKGNCHSGGKEWHEFYITNMCELEEGVKLISSTYSLNL